MRATVGGAGGMAMGSYVTAFAPADDFRVESHVRIHMLLLLRCNDLDVPAKQAAAAR